VVERRKEARAAEAVAALSTIITSSSSLEELLDRALGVMLEASGAEAGGIYLLDEDKKELKLAAHRGLSPEFVSWAKAHPLGQGLTGRAGAERRPVVCPDLLREFPELEEIIRQEGFRGQVSLPLLAQERLLGVVNLNSRKALDLPEEELALLRLISEWLAQAIELGRLLQRERARARREAALAAIGRALSRSLEPQSFLNAVLEELGLALEFEIGAVYLIEGEEFVLASHRGLSAEFAAKAARNPLDHYILGKVISSGEPLEVREFLSSVTKEEGLKYAAYVPLRTPERPLGVLILGTRSERALGAEELELLEAVGAQLGLALGQAEAANEVQYWREFHEELLERLPVGILRLDREGRIVYQNAALREILGVPGERSAALGRKLTELPNVIATGLVPELEALLRAGKEVRAEEVPFTSLYGKHAILSLVGLPLCDRAGALDGALLLIEDVTRVRASERLRESLLEIADEILSAEEIEPILRRVARAIIELSPFQRAAIALYDLKHEPPLEGALVQAVAAGLTPEEEARLFASSLSPEQRRLAFSERFRIGNSYYIPHDQVPWGKELGLPGRVSLDGWHPEDFLFIPLRSERGIIGHISVDDPRVPQAVDEAVLGPLEVFAGLSALAVERAARLQELRRQKERLREVYRFSHRLVSEAELGDLFQRALELLEREFDYDYATIQLLKGGELEVVAERLRAPWEGSFLGKRIPLGEGLSGWAAAQRRAVRVEDCSQDPRFIPSFPEIQAELAVPLLFGEELLGVIDVESRRRGAFTPEDEELLSAIAAQLALAIQEVREREALKELSIRDPLTGLFNRRYLHEALGRELERSQRYGHRLALLMLDLDNFREVNNRFGHAKGDEVLRELAQLLRENVRASDLVFRYGGDEFLILMPETEVEPKQAVGRLKRAVEEWNKEKQAKGFDLRLGLSIGAVSWSPKEGRSPSIEELLDSADRLLYREKHGSER
jgi:diguanylate cyclase (GGDEF)-like protein/PAS domain S-box-containing protein